MTVVALCGWAGLAAAQNAEVDVQLDQFGVGSAYRPAEHVGMRLVVTSNLAEPTPCWVQVEIPNAEGDIQEIGRSVTLGPGAPTPIWLYGVLPPNAGTQSVWVVRVFEEEDGRRGRELGGTRISPRPLPIDTRVGLIGVVGRVDMNLAEYENPGGPWPLEHPPAAHEPTRVIAGIEPADLPDRWEGLRAFEAIGWSNAAPGDLRFDAANALREYVRRGGHLIISLPQAGNPWGLGTIGQTYLDDLLPRQAPRTDEAVPLRTLMPVLSKTDEPWREVDLSIRVFKDIEGGFDAIDNRYEPLIALPDGRVVVIQRRYGFGRITICGIEITSQLRSMRLPEGDVFWNRVLGRRGDTPRVAELSDMDAQSPSKLRKSSATTVTVGDGGLFAHYLDKPSSASLGLLVSVLLFAAYLLLAGPGGFYLLKQRGLVRHSWVAFAATAAAFTAVSWGGMRLMRHRSTEIRHVTVLDHIARPAGEPMGDEPPLQQAAAWMSLYLPSYGTVRVAIDSEPGERDLLSTWTDPQKVPQRFPNVDRYVIPVGRSPDREDRQGHAADYRIPVRASATQFYAHWHGALSEDWGGLIRADPNDAPRVVDDATGPPRLAGTLVHDLPGTLTDPTLIWVTSERGPRLRYDYDPAEEKELPWTREPPSTGRPTLNTGYMVRLAKGRWAAGEPLSLLAAFGAPGPATRLESEIHKLYVAKDEGSAWNPGIPSRTTRLDPARRRQFIEMLSLYQLLTPPKYHREGRRDPDTMVAARHLGRELDLSGWFNRPCLIVIGYLEDSESPVPLLVDGKRPPNNDGLTVVRWIYPLPLDEDEPGKGGAP